MKAPVVYASTLDKREADYRFKRLWEELAWVRHDKVPRREYYVHINCYAQGNDPAYAYTYGRGQGVRTYMPQPGHSVLTSLWCEAEQAADTQLQVCFMNGYEDASDQLGWHSDNSPEMDDDKPIVIISLGAEREIWFRKTPILDGRCIACNGSGHYDSGGSPPCGACGGSGKEPAPEIDRLSLQHGSTCVMQPGMQDTHQHRIPKSHRSDIGPRLSLTFRGYKAP